jgi:hypothetical protein
MRLIRFDDEIFRTKKFTKKVRRALESELEFWLMIRLSYRQALLPKVPASSPVAFYAGFDKGLFGKTEIRKKLQRTNTIIRKLRRGLKVGVIPVYEPAV